MDEHPRNPNGTFDLRGARSSAARRRREFHFWRRQFNSIHMIFSCTIDIGGSASHCCCANEKERLYVASAFVGSAASWTGTRRFRLLAASYALMGQVKRARNLLSEFGGASSLVTLRCLGYENYRSTAYAEQYERYRHGLRLADFRDHSDEVADFGVIASDELNAPIAGLTPRAAPGAETIGTATLAVFLERHAPIVIDTLGHFWGSLLPNAIGLPNLGVGGRLTDLTQSRLGRIMRRLTSGDLSTPIVAVGFNSERFDGRNLALRLVALGYSNVHWYRGGREAWEVAGLKVAPLVPQAW